MEEICGQVSMTGIAEPCSLPKGHEGHHSSKIKRSESDSFAAYNSHTWIGHRSYIPGEPDDYDEYCSACGCTNLGDPIEFPDLEYPFCDEMGD